MIFPYKKKKERRKKAAHLKLIHHFPDPNTLLANYETMEIKRNVYFNGNWNQSLKNMSEKKHQALVCRSYTVLALDPESVS